jgi:nucleotide-binding universal stress UspA family protein
MIIHATDFSPASRAAFRKAVELTRQTGDRLLLVHVLNPALLFVGERPIMPPTYGRLQAASRAWALTQLTRLTARARAARVRVTSLLLEGSEAGTIVRLARAQRAAMIVIGTHGRTGIERMLLGSVAARVVSLASCPVMTVRGR